MQALTAFATGAAVAGLGTYHLYHDVWSSREQVATAAALPLGRGAVKVRAEPTRRRCPLQPCSRPVGHVGVAVALPSAFLPLAPRRTMAGWSVEAARGDSGLVHGPVERCCEGAARLPREAPLMQPARALALEPELGRGQGMPLPWAPSRQRTSGGPQRPPHGLLGMHVTLASLPWAPACPRRARRPRGTGCACSHIGWYNVAAASLRVGPALDALRLQQRWPA